MRTLDSSPSHGVDEVLDALRRARGYPGRHIRPALLKRHLPVRVPLDDIVTVLDAQVTAGRVNKSGDDYALTDVGEVYARSHRRHDSPIWDA